ncbi:MAG: DUF2330 domain-containing protein [Actinomycetales bacterium]|nr:DUF2330 domain-containing protein [Actinomycetales bacterium]
MTPRAAIARRLVAAAAIAALGGALLVVAPVAPAAACGCGAPAPIDGSSVGVDGETAIVSWEGAAGRSGAGGTERIDLRLDMISDAAETGLILPTPAPASVALGDPQDFADLARTLDPPVETRDDWWGGLGGSGGGEAGGAPVVLDRVQLGPLEASTLAADDADALRAWLDENGYGIRPEIQELLGDYVARGWYFVALRLTGDLPLDGELDPVRVSFPSEALVYPLALSRAAERPQTVRLYAFDAHRLDAAPLGGGAALPQQAVLFSGPAPAGFEARGARLTVLEMWFADPAAQIPGDLALVAAPSDEPVAPAARIEVRPVALLGLGLGWWIVALVVVAVLVGAALAPGLGARRRASRRVRTDSRG